MNCLEIKLNKIDNHSIISLVKSIFKEMGIKHESLSCKLKYDNKIVNTTIYTFNIDDLNKYI